MEQSQNKEDKKEEVIEIDDASIVYAWSDEDEKFLKNYAEEAMCWEYMHDFSANIYAVRERKLYYVQLFLSTLATLSVIQNQFTDVDVRNYICIILAIINAFITAIQILNTKLKISENHEKYHNLSKQWVKLKNDIELELHKSRNERTEKKILIHTMKKIYNDLIFGQILPTHEAKQEFVKNYGDLTIHKPSILGDFNEIVVNTSFVLPIKEPVNEQKLLEMSLIATFKNRKGREPTEKELADLMITENLAHSSLV
ncbi:hypothetical protein FJZ55_07070 [Candidatus Woesearchaeota archaeon]|nr:hypothetical protein [Candidatus Woesearchaeota archaeon]